MILVLEKNYLKLKWQLWQEQVKWKANGFSGSKILIRFDNGFIHKPSMQYKDVFQGISCLLGDYYIDADPTVLPVQHL